MSFLEQSDVNAVLDRLASEDDLTLFAGAGTSMEVGFPSWGALLDRLLRSAAVEAGLVHEAVEEFLASCWADGMGVLGIGSLARSQLGSDPDTYIRAALYEQDSQSARIATQEPGPAARALVAFFASWPLGCVEIATTNYDLLLERALDLLLEELSADGKPLEVAPGQLILRGASGREGPQVGPAGELRIRHLHGALDRKSSPDDLHPAVLGETDYHEVQASQSWQSQWIQPRLADSTWLFVGASMSDANVLRYLQSARATGRPPHVALLTREQGKQPSDPKGLALWTEATTARWAEFGVQALYPDYYSDVAAFLDELRRRHVAVVRGSGPMQEDRLPERLRRWQKAVTSPDGLLPEDGPSFSDRQDGITALLADLTSEAVRLLRDTPGVADCDFGLQLWIPTADGARLVMWGSSQHSWRDPNTLAPLVIEPHSKWLSIETWCRGTPTLRTFGETHGTRWAAALGIPLILTSEPWGRLPVGVGTFNVMGQKADGLLERVDSEALASVVSLLGEALVDLLTPEPVVPPA